MEPTAKNVKKALEKLGSHPNEVADRLRAARIKGYRGNSYHCPIAQYLNQTFDTSGYFSVWRMAWFNDLAVKTPAPVFRFIQQFDIGKLPEFEAK